MRLKKNMAKPHITFNKVKNGKKITTLKLK
jgi:hypothetical protein